MRKTSKSKPLLFAIVLALLLGGVAYKRLAVYGYDVGRDYSYDFKSADATVVPGRIAAGKLTAEGPLAGFDTVIAELTLESTWSGLLVEPALQISAAGRSLTQALEMGGRGMRYLNLSNLLTVDGPREFDLQPARLKIPDQPVRLFCFRNAIDRQARILVIAPHPDDAEIAAFGFYASHPNTTIVTITAGDAGRNKYDEVYADRAEQALKKGQLRVWNSITVPLLGGVPPGRSVNLGYFDAKLREMAADPQTPVAPKYAALTETGVFRGMNESDLLAGRASVPTWQNLVGDLEQIIDAVQPEIIVAPYPRIDAHPDHQYSTLAMIEALKHLGIKTGKLLLYTNHCTESDYVPYGAMSSSISLPPAFDGLTYFNSIYSFALPPALQKDKYFALEAMNDLRLDTEWRTVSGTASYLFKLLNNVVFNKDFSYFRRAVRGNELFFVVAVENVYSPGIASSLYPLSPPKAQL